jgi:hypothetical protein
MKKMKLLIEVLLVLIVIIVFVVTGYLYVVRCGETRFCKDAFVELNTASEIVTMTLSRTGFNELATLVSEVRIPRAKRAILNDVALAEEERILIKSSGAPLSLTIPAFTISDSSRPFLMTIRHLQDGTSRFAIVTPPNSIKIKVASRDGAFSALLGPNQTPSKTKGLLLLEAALDEVEFTLAEKEYSSRRPFDITGLSFYDAVDPIVPQETAVSGLRSGTLRFEEIYGIKERQFGEGNNLSIRGLDGQINLLRISENQIQTEFSGNAQSLKMSWNNKNATNLMPTVFERYLGDPAIVAVLTLIVAVLTLYIAIKGLRAW